MLSRPSLSPSQQRSTRFCFSNIKNRLSDLRPRRHSSPWTKMSACNEQYSMLESERPVGVELVEHADVVVDDMPSTSAVVELLPPYSPTEVTPSVTIQEISPAALTRAVHHTPRQIRSLCDRNGRVRFPAIEWGEAHPRGFEDSPQPISHLRHAGLRIGEGNLVIRKEERIPPNSRSSMCGESISSGHEAIEGGDMIRRTEEGHIPRTAHPDQSRALLFPVHQDIYPSSVIQSSKFSDRPVTSFRDIQASMQQNNGLLSPGMDGTRDQSSIPTMVRKPSSSRTITSETVTGEELETSGERLYQSNLQEAVLDHEPGTDEAAEESVLRKDSHHPTGEADDDIIPKPETLPTNGEALKQHTRTGGIARMYRERHSENVIDKVIVVNGDGLTDTDEIRHEGTKSRDADTPYHNPGNPFRHKRERHPPLMEACSRPIYTGPRKANPLLYNQTDTGKDTVEDSNERNQIQQRADTVAYNCFRDGGLTPPSPMPKVCLATSAEMDLMQEARLTRDRLHDGGLVIGSVVQEKKLTSNGENPTDRWASEDESRLSGRQDDDSESMTLRREPHRKVGAKRSFYKALGRPSPLRHSLDYSGTPPTLENLAPLHKSPHLYYQEGHPRVSHIERMGYPREVPGRTAALLSSKIGTGEIPWARLSFAEQSRRLGDKSSRAVKTMAKAVKRVVIQTASKMSEGEDTETGLERARADALRDIGRVIEIEVLGTMSSFAYGISGL